MLSEVLSFQKKILGEFSYTSVQISHVQECIRTHRFRGMERPESIEAKILFDADKLDATGCIGIARTLMYKGIIGEPLYSFDMDSLAIDYDSPSFIENTIVNFQKLFNNYIQNGRWNYGKCEIVMRISFMKNCFLKYKRYLC